MIKVLLLAGNTARARAYAQILSEFKGKIQVSGLFYGFNEKKYYPPEMDSTTLSFLKENKLFIPNLEEDLKTTFNKMNWKYDDVDTVDVNSDVILSEISKNESEIVIFCGYGGQILKPLHFSQNKKYLHFHPGELPLERGSTTIYYSILNRRNCSVSGFYMTEKIDSGENILCTKYPIPIKGVNIDSWYDNVVRADCLRQAIPLIQNSQKNWNIINSQNEEYYVIHPVLKHVALLSLK